MAVPATRAIWRPGVRSQTTPLPATMGTRVRQTTPVRAVRAVEPQSSATTAMAVPATRAIWRPGVRSRRSKTAPTVRTITRARSSIGARMVSAPAPS